MTPLLKNYWISKIKNFITHSLGFISLATMKESVTLKKSPEYLKNHIYYIGKTTI